MPCLLCDSCDHLTQYCDKYVTDKERNEYLFSINTCKYCKASYSKYYTYCIQCEPVTKCLTCFSRQHHTFFCPVRSNSTKWFLPKIDKDLLHRFFKTFDALEQYSLIISIPEASNFINLQPVQVKKSINLRSYSSRSGCIDVIDDEINLKGFERHEYDEIPVPPPQIPYEKRYPRIIEALSKNRIYFKARIVALQNLKIHSQDFLHLLSNNTQILKLSNVKFISNIKLSEILEKIKNAEEILLRKSNVKIENNWVEDLQKFGSKIKTLEIPVENLDFNVKLLAEIIKTMLLQISLYWNSSLSKENACKVLTSEQFSNYFSPPSTTFLSVTNSLMIHIKFRSYHLKPL